MNVQDEEYFSQIKTIFSIFPTLFSSDTALGLTDLEKYQIILQAKTFKLNASEGMELPKGGASEKAIKNKQKGSMRYPKEAFGFPIVVSAIPIINPNTGNVVGSIVTASSLEKESAVIEMANELQSFSDELSNSSEKLASSTREMASDSKNVQNLVTETQQGITSMDDIIKYLKDIAHTTNLLGLNASIEAARANEHGRGFSVVATEIRKLATNSNDSTANINETLSKIKKDINDIASVLNGFLTTNEAQAAQAEQIAIESQKLGNLSNKLLKLSQDVID